MKKILLFAAALLTGFAAQAQVIAYDIQTKTTDYVEMTDGNVIDLQGTVGEDLSKVLLDADGGISFTKAEDVTAFPIGFDFGFDGKTMKYFLLTGDGAVLLYEEPTVTTDIHVQGYSTPTMQICEENKAKNAFGAMAREGGFGFDDTEISYKVEGTAGERVLVIQFKNLGWQSGAWDVEDMAKAQIQYRLYEATGNIEMKVNSWKPYDGVAVGNYNWMRVGLVGDVNDFLFLNRFDANGAESLSQKNEYIDYNASSYPADGTTWTFIAPQPCERPAVAPTALALTSTTDAVSGTFTAGTSDHYLVLVSQFATLAETPADKKKYEVGQTLGKAYVAAITDGATTTFTTPAAWSSKPATEYHVFVFGFNSLCSAGPLYNAEPAVASISTKPSGPAAIAADNVDKTGFTVSATGNGTSSVLIACTDVQALDRWNSYIDSGLFGQPAGRYTVGDEIEGGGKVIYIGQGGESVSLGELESGKPYFVRAWSSDGHGGYSSEYVETTVVTAATLPWALTIDDKTGYEACMPGWTKNDNLEWNSDPDEAYIYNRTDVIDDATTGAVAWIESPYICLGKAKTKISALVGGSARSGWMMSDWTLADGEKVVFQVTADGINYTDVLTIDKDDATLSRSPLTPFEAEFKALAGQKVRLRVYIQRLTRGEVRLGQITLAEVEDATGIDTAETGNENAGNKVFNLNGQRVKTTQAGQLYVRDGRKFIAR